MIDSKTENKIVHDNKYLNFSLAEEKFAMPLFLVKEVISTHKITVLPNVPNYCKGIINLRGQVIPIIDLKQKMKLPSPANKSTESSMIILTLEDNTIGVIVDSVDSVLEFKAEIMSDVPSAQDIKAEYIMGVAKIQEKMILILDMNKILNNNLTSHKKAA